MIRSRRRRTRQFDVESVKNEAAAIVAARLQSLNQALSQVELLIRVANGEFVRATAEDSFVADVAAALRNAVDVFVAESKVGLPAFWNNPGIGQVCAIVAVWLYGDDLLSYTDAAYELFDDAESLQPSTLIQRIRSLITRGMLTPYVDPRQPNPRHAQRQPGLAAAGRHADHSRAVEQPQREDLGLRRRERGAVGDVPNS